MGEVGRRFLASHELPVLCGLMGKLQESQKIWARVTRGLHPETFYGSPSIPLVPSQALPASAWLLQAGDLRPSLSSMAF